MYLQSTYMKKLILLTGLCFALTFADANAQSYKTSTLSFQPLWGPSGFKVASYYYLPDIDIYYDVTAKQFIHLEEGEWIFSRALPEQFKDYDLYNGYKVVLNLPQPYLNIAAHRVRYARFKGQFNKQVSIRDSNKPKYVYVPGHIYTLQSVLKTSSRKTAQ